MGRSEIQCDVFWVSSGFPVWQSAIQFGGPLPRREERPLRGVVKLHIERGWTQSKTRIPSAPGADVQQPVACVRKYFSCIAKAQSYILAVG